MNRPRFIESNQMEKSISLQRVKCKNSCTSISGQLFNQVKPNGVSHSYQLDQSISVLRVGGRFFHFLSNFDRTFCKQIASDLGLHCLSMR